MLFAFFLLTVSAFADPMPKANITTSPTAIVTWDPGSLDRVEVISTIIRWDVGTYSPAETMLEEQTILVTEKGEELFDDGSSALTGPESRISATRTSSSPDELFAECLVVTMTHVEQPRLPTQSLAFRFFSASDATIKELTPKQWEDIVDPITETTNLDGTTSRTQRGYARTVPE